MAIPGTSIVKLYLDEDKRDGPMNMAIDEALLRNAHHAVIRFYRWEKPTLSIGYFQSFAELSRQNGGLPLVRRWTGGGMVSHGSDCTFSIITPRGEGLAALTPAASYAAIHEGMIHALGKPEFRLARCEDMLSGSACFQSPALHDVLLDSVKIAGGAQRRTRTGFLHQGSIQQTEVPLEFPARFAAQFGEKVEMAALSGEVLESARQIANERYGTTQWLTKF